MRKLIEKSDDVDWDTLIQQAEFLHHNEQKQLQKRERHWRKKQRKKAALRHKKYLAVGAFSANLVAIDAALSIKPSNALAVCDAVAGPIPRV